MKKFKIKGLIAVVVCFSVFVVGCSMFTPKVIQDTSKIGVVAFLKNNPKFIKPVLDGLKVIYDYTSCGVCGVADMKNVIAAALPGDYKEIGAIILAAIDDEMLTSTIDEALNRNLSAETVKQIGDYAKSLSDAIKLIQ